MKRILCALAAVTALWTAASAQTYDVLETVRADRLKARGCEGPYRFDAPALTPAPKGYAPFYISHYGRHGSRWAWNRDTYVVVKRVLEAARDAGALTAFGEQVYRGFMDIYDVAYANTGDLCDLGWEQHGGIAAETVRNFPEVFAGGGEVVARSSTSQRSIVSMNAFTVSLQKHAPKVHITGSSFHTDNIVTNTYDTPQFMRRSYAGTVSFPESVDSFRNRKVDAEAILSRLFTSHAFFEEIGGRTRFLYELFALWCGYPNYTEDLFMEGLYTEDEIVAQWEVENYNCFVGHTSGRYNFIPTLEDIISRADEVIAEGGRIADLRFGHDYVVNAFCPLINLDGSGRVMDDADQVKYWFRTYDTPKAATLQLVFYRSRKNPDILFKVLRNGAEATLPQLTPVSGPYYRWTDFTDWAGTLMADHPVIQ